MAFVSKGFICVFYYLSREVLTCNESRLDDNSPDNPRFSFGTTLAKHFVSSLHILEPKPTADPFAPL